MKRFFSWLSHYLVFFLLVAFVTTCCMTLFLSALTESIRLELTAEHLNAAAKLTFANVLLLSLLFTLIDGLRRRYTVDRPVCRIISGAERLMQGDLSARIQPPPGISADDPFSRISDCFNRMAAELQGVETLRSDFIANVSHELKTPLAVLQNYGVLLQDPALPQAQRLEYARGVSSGARRMAELVSNILRLNRLENQQIFPRAEEFDLSEQLCQCLLQYESVWEQKSLRLETDIADGVRLRADSELLELVWSNLLSNAFKFTPPGGAVSVRLAADETQVSVCISDTGCGMSPEVGRHIFEKFYQGDSSHAAQGNGLGLALVKRVMDILHGEIRVDSAPGRGSSFTVYLPRA